MRRQRKTSNKEPSSNSARGGLLGSYRYTRLFGSIERSFPYTAPDCHLPAQLVHCDTYKVSDLQECDKSRHCLSNIPMLWQVNVYSTDGHEKSPAYQMQLLPSQKTVK